jgi:hypothetical protein
MGPFSIRYILKLRSSQPVSQVHIKTECNRQTKSTFGQQCYSRNTLNMRIGIFVSTPAEYIPHSSDSSLVPSPSSLQLRYCTLRGIPRRFAAVNNTALLFRILICSQLDCHFLRHLTKLFPYIPLFHIPFFASCRRRGVSTANPQLI